MNLERKPEEWERDRVAPTENSGATRHYKSEEGTMGLEAKCKVSYGGRASEGAAQLEQDAIYFKGDFRLKILFKEMKSFEARRGVLTVKTAAGAVAFHLGREAEKWALKLRYPRSRMEKLGVKAGMRISVLGVEDKTFWSELEALTENVTDGRAAAGSDMIFLGVEDVAGLGRLKALAKSIQPAGAIWVVWPKGRAEIKEDHVREMAKAVGLVDVKVCAFSDVLSGLKLVIPVKARGNR